MQRRRRAFRASRKRSCEMMQKGGKYTVTIPAEKAYGANPLSGRADPAERRPDLRDRAGRTSCRWPRPSAASIRCSR